MYVIITTFERRIRFRAMHVVHLGNSSPLVHKLRATGVGRMGIYNQSLIVHTPYDIRRQIEHARVKRDVQTPRGRDGHLLAGRQKLQDSFVSMLHLPTEAKRIVNAQLDTAQQRRGNLKENEAVAPIPIDLHQSSAALVLPPLQNFAQSAAVPIDVAD